MTHAYASHEFKRSQRARIRELVDRRATSTPEVQRLVDLEIAEARRALRLIDRCLRKAHTD